MSASVVFMFSGQGSQYYGMGLELFRYHAMFRKGMEELDEIFGDHTGGSVIACLYSEQRAKPPFKDLLYTHAAIFMVEYALAQLVIEEGITPQFVTGSSMGEFASASVSGIISVEDGLTSVITQAQSIIATCEKGVMIAILHTPEIMQSWPVLQQYAELVAVNFSSHFVISALANSLTFIEAELKKQRVTYQLLPVSYAFHSSYIEPAATSYLDFLQSVSISAPQIPFISCLTGGRLAAIQSNYFWDIIRDPIDFRGALNSLPEHDEYVYVDLGPSGTLATFTKYSLPERSVNSRFTLLPPYGANIEQFTAMIRQIKTRS
ncbi:acyl transferase domain-containing protein [Paenibacillus shirakamiensis]|uniref:Acyl transferase domain-containing protein n=1 Tax=Paenibacillus shirakamiensis TaxID=1265935 RepID=A0ABS4JEN2_9BACL|nr:acyltransferase domain-containing protein [Paenibacillus shirakamiensis]MBP2000166.1 acyl transferase domain-containing protein [Paenibacillus shirakamiensis]